MEMKATVEVSATLRSTWQACTVALATSKFNSCRSLMRSCCFFKELTVLSLLQSAGWSGSAGGYQDCPGVQ